MPVLSALPAPDKAMMAVLVEQLVPLTRALWRSAAVPELGQSDVQTDNRDICLEAGEELPLPSSFPEPSRTLARGRAAA